MNQTSRRGFIASIAALTGSSFITGDAAEKPDLGNDTWDLTWLDKLPGKHRQIFDLQEIELRVINNWLDAYEEVFQLKHPDVNAVVGIAGKAFPINASDELYRRFPIGEHWKVTDPDTQKPALRNIFLDGAKNPAEQKKTVKALQARGAMFWQCNKALHRLSNDLAIKVGRTEPEVYEEIRAGLNPGVIVVPAHAMMIGLAQQRGFTYEFLM